MSKTRVRAPTSLLEMGHARVEITPPVGIYHRRWGAARHEHATGAPCVLGQGACGDIGPRRGSPGDVVERIAQLA